MSTSKRTGYFETLLSRRARTVAPQRSFAPPRTPLPGKLAPTLKGAAALPSTPAAAAPRDAASPFRSAPSRQPEAIGRPPERAARAETAPVPKKIPAPMPRNETQPAPTATEAAPRPVIREVLPDIEDPSPAQDFSILHMEPASVPARAVSEVPTQLAAAEPGAPRIESRIDWPPELDAGQRSNVRIEVERVVRERVSAVPAARSVSPQKIEVRVDQVNVRFDAPAPARAPSAARASGENAFSALFRSRSLR